MTSHAPPPLGDESSRGKPPPPPENGPREEEPPDHQRPQRSENLEAELGALEATLPEESYDTKDQPDSR